MNGIYNLLLPYIWPYTNGLPWGYCTPINGGMDTYLLLVEAHLVPVFSV